MTDKSYATGAGRAPQTRGAAWSSQGGRPVFPVSDVGPGAASGGKDDDSSTEGSVSLIIWSTYSEELSKTPRRETSFI